MRSATAPLRACTCPSAVPSGSTRRAASTAAAIALIALLLATLTNGCTLRQEVRDYLAGPPPFPGLVGARDPDSLTESEIDRRLDFLTTRLDETRMHVLLWHYGWLTINTGGAVWSSLNASWHHGNSRIGDAMEAGKSLIGVTYIL